MNKSKSMYIDVFVVGFALFSMFFGAGNVIFPPYLGLFSGTEWVEGFVSYFIADIGLAIITIFALVRCNGRDGITDRIGIPAATVLMSAVVLCIGPMLAIPRTAATTFSMAIVPNFEAVSADSLAASAIFAVVFFGIVLALTIKESAVVDIVGKILTPLLLIGLAIIIILGIVNPLGQAISVSHDEGVIITGIKSGYQTMDVLAAMVFGVMIMKSADAKGYAGKEKSKMVIFASVVATVLLCFVYGGLTYLGSSVSAMFNVDEISRADLIVTVVNMLAGKAGTAVFGIVVGLACLTTAIGLVSSAAEFFVKISKGKLTYKGLVIGMCIFSAVICNLGLDTIISIAAPVLDIVYPPMLVLIIIALTMPKLPNLVSSVAVATAFIISVLKELTVYGVNIAFISKLPLYNVDLCWIVPTLATGILAFIVAKIIKAPECDLVPELN